MKKSMYYILLLFFAGSVVGWLWEVLVFWCTHRGYSLLSVFSELRGVLHGPWVPIYGFGCVLLVLLGRYMKPHPGRFLAASIGVCGIMEYATSFALEKIFQARWWDYSDALLNLQGRICAGGLLFFGLAGMVIVYKAEPEFWSVVKRIPLWLQKTLAAVLLLLFLADTIPALFSPNMGIGVIRR